MPLQPQQGLLKLRQCQSAHGRPGGWKAIQRFGLDQRGAGSMPSTDGCDKSTLLRLLIVFRATSRQDPMTAGRPPASNAASCSGSSPDTTGQYGGTVALNAVNVKQQQADKAARIGDPRSAWSACGWAYLPHQVSGGVIWRVAILRGRKAGRACFLSLEQAVPALPSTHYYQQFAGRLRRPWLPVSATLLVTTRRQGRSLATGRVVMETRVRRADQVVRWAWRASARAR